MTNNLLLIKKHTRQNKKTALLHDQFEEIKLQEGTIEEKSKLIEAAVEISCAMEFATDEFI